MAWDDILKDKDFQAEPQAIKDEVARNYFKANFEIDPGFQSETPEVKDKIFSNFLKTVAPPARGPIATGISAIGGGLVGGAEIVSRALRGADQPGGADIIRGIGDIGVRGVKALEEKFPILKPAPDEGIVPQGIRSAVQSLSTSVPLAVAGGIAGNIPGVVTALGAGSAALYGLAEKDRFIEEAKAAMDAGITPKISDEELYAQANKAALVEGGLEGLSNVLGFAFTGAGKLLKKPLKGALAPTIKEAFLKTTPKTAVATIGKVLAEEIPTEVAQEEGGAALRREIGVPAPEFGAGLAVIPATTVSSIILASVGMGAGGLRRRSVLNALDNPNLDDKRRIDAVNAVASEMKKSDPSTAAAWKEKAYGLVAKKQAIPDDINAIIAKPTGIVPPTTSPAGPVTRAAQAADITFLKPPTPQEAAGLESSAQQFTQAKGLEGIIPTIPGVPAVVPPKGIAQAEEAAKKPAIHPQGLVNSITRKEAGDMLAAGNEEVLSHIAEGVIEKGRSQVEDAIRNEGLAQIASVPKGAEREAIRQNIIKLEPAINEVLANPTEATPEARQNVAVRSMIDEMTPKQQKEAIATLRKERRTNEKSGILNLKAYVDDAKKPVQVFSDIDDLHGINEEGGHPFGDVVIKAKSRYLTEEAGKEDTYHVSGDEFYTQFEATERANTVHKKAGERLSNTVFDIVDQDGKILSKVKGVGYSFGTGKDIYEAESAQARHKEERAKAGLRTGERGKGAKGLIAVPESAGPGDYQVKYVGKLSPEEVRARYLKKLEAQGEVAPEVGAEEKPPKRKAGKISKEAISDSGIEALFDAGRFDDFLKFTEALTPEQKKKYEAAISVAKYKMEYKPPVEQPTKIDRELVDAIKEGEAWIADNVDIWNTPEGEVARNELEKEGKWWGIAKKPTKPTKAPPVQAESINLDAIPEGLTLEVKAIREKTGKEVTIKEDARTAIEDSQATVDKYESLLECLRT